jgi:hypothetical protein
VKGSVCVFCEGRAEEEEKVKHVGRLLCLPGVSHFCPPPLFCLSVFRLQGVSQSADSREPKLNATFIIGMTTLIYSTVTV